MVTEPWEGRGYPWEYDPGPPKNRCWPRLFSETPNYRQLGKILLGREKFRWHFGPMYYRGRLRDNEVKVLVIGQEGAQDESLSHRSFTGFTGSVMQHLLNYIGITESYLFLNTFAYPIFNQYTEPELKWLAQNPDSPIVKHRQEIFNYVLDRNDVHLVVAAGIAAKESVVTWVKSRGGNCPSGTQDISQCTGDFLDPSTKVVGVIHPASPGSKKADYESAIAKIKLWMDNDANWLPPDPDGSRQFSSPYKFKRAPIPFRDLHFGCTPILGRGKTTSNRGDHQRSIQVYSSAGNSDNTGVTLSYSDLAYGTKEGYGEDQGDLPYEPPRKNYRTYDKGPGKTFAKLFMGGKSELEWPDFQALGATVHSSFGNGPIYRGRPSSASILVFADQQSNDDLLTGRALSGESGQHLQAFLESIGIIESYVIIRIFPVDTLDLDTNGNRAILADAQVQKMYQAITGEVIEKSSNIGLVLTFGPTSRTLLGSLSLGRISTASLKSWDERGALQDWQGKLQDIQLENYKRDIANPSFVYDGRRGQIPRIDLPYGFLRWQGTSSNRVRRAKDEATQLLSPDYYKIFMPEWAFSLDPAPLSSSEQVAVQNAVVQLSDD